MAVNISNTAHYKKGEKLPDGTIAKRGVVWNTKTGKRVTGTVMMAGAGQGGMSATKSYKGGRSVASIKASKQKGRRAAVDKTPSSPTPKKEMTAAAKKAKQVRTGRRAVDTAGRAGMAMAREKSGASQRPVSDESKRVSRRAGATPTTTSANKYGITGYARGVGGVGAAATQSRVNQMKKEYGASTARGAMRAKGREDQRNQLRNVAGVAAGTIGPALLATPAGAAAAGAAGRAAASAAGRTAAAAGKVTRPVLGGTSKSGKSTSNRVSVALLKAQKRLERAKAARAKAAKAKGKKK